MYEGPQPPEVHMPLNVPPVAIGFLTKLGVIVGALSALIAAALAIANGDHSTEALGAFITAAAAFYATITARGKQAAANTQAVAAIRSAELQSTPSQAPPTVMFGNMQASRPLSGVKSIPTAQTGYIGEDDDRARDAMAEDAAADYTDDVRLDDPDAIPPDEGSPDPRVEPRA